MTRATELRLSDFHYDLPPERIAQEPVTPRDSSKLMVVESGTDLRHHRFTELDQILRPGDLLVLNATRVFPARLRGQKVTGGKAEILLLDQRGPDASHWRALVRGAMNATELRFPEGLSAVMTERLAEGEWLLRFSQADVRNVLERHGEMPLPPYIKRAAPQEGDRNRYQTVFAQQEGAVAAPTAGFHFTPELLKRLEAKDIERQEIVLHVGWGTFRPVRTESIESHQMLPEWSSLSVETARALNKARAQGRRVVAVGTTVVRTLESRTNSAGQLEPGHGETNLFIFPGYRFKAIDALITNFHLPDSTPILLASAFFAQKSGATDPFSLRAAYAEAIQKDYRFYSYGDAMLIQ